MQLGLAEASVLVAVITAISGLVGIVITSRRERENAAQAAVAKTETEMERVLRERLELRDEQIEHLKTKTAEQTAQLAQQQLQITELTERLGTLHQEVHHE